MHRTSSRVLLVVAAFVLSLVPVAAIAAGGFGDVPDDNVFKTDIVWLAAAGVTKGCNPPANTEFCPGSNVTREQMAAFMHRLAVNKVVDAATAVDADNADTLDGKDSGAFAPAGHNHDGSYLESGDIVMAVSGSNWRTVANATAPSVGSYGSYVFVAGDGFIELGLDAPVMVGTTNYRLGSVEVCFELVSGGAYIDQTSVMVASIGANQQFLASDGTDRVASGCHTLDVSASTPNGASVRLQIGGGGALNVYGVRALWEPAP